MDRPGDFQQCDRIAFWHEQLALRKLWAKEGSDWLTVHVNQKSHNPYELITTAVHGRRIVLLPDLDSHAAPHSASNCLSDWLTDPDSRLVHRRGKLDSNSGTTGGCNSLGQKMEDSADRVGHDESSNDATQLEETERSSRDGEPSVSGNNRSTSNHNASAWTNLSVDESVLSNLAPLGGNPLLNISHLGFHPSSAAIQEELMAHARLEHRLRVQILRMQKRAWNLKLEWLERRRTRSRQNAGRGSEAAASASLNAGSTSAATDASLQNGNSGGDGWAIPRGDLAGDDEEEDDEEDEEDEEEEDL
ncbi:unnamed protein product [Schistocephalus solidus]|uniref:Pecanex-like protein n=1 Tax=Schistocephalus solidus TaxID=70667 RepID=A0A183T3S2_SCHSO|nr:unnamed protein product [Schistocephalus solidus]